MSCTIQEFRLRHSEFCDENIYSDCKINLMLQDASKMMRNESEWCGFYNQAQSLLAAHMLILNLNRQAGNTSANVGQVVSKSVDGVSVSKQINSAPRSAEDDFYMQSSYGQQYIIMRNKCIIPVTLADYPCTSVYLR